MRNTVTKPDEHYGKGKNTVLRVLNARVSLPSWMLALSSCALAWFAAYLTLFGPGLEEFGEALPVEGFLWVPCLVVATTATVVGLLFKNRVAALKYGSFASFVAWIFGGIAFAASEQALTTIIVVVPWLLFYAYVYLASFFRDSTGI